MRVEELIFRPLIGLDSQRRFVPSLALSWAVSSDGLVYDLRLDPKARWEDGSPVTSKDVVYTIERVRDPKVPSTTWRWGFEDVVSIETPDALTAIVRYRGPYAGRLYAFTLPVVSAAAYARPSEIDRKPVGQRAVQAGGLDSEPIPDASAPRRRPRLHLSVPKGRLPDHPRQLRTLPGGNSGRARRVLHHPGPGPPGPALAGVPIEEPRDQGAPLRCRSDQLELPQPRPRRSPCAAGARHVLAASRDGQTALPAGRSDHC